MITFKCRFDKDTCNYVYEPSWADNRCDKVEITRDSEYLRISFGELGWVIIQAQGECCSTCWFDEIVNVDRILGAKVIKIIQTDLGSKGEVNYTVIDSYCLTIETDKGDCRVIFRNESEGYYGGDIRFVNALDPKHEIMDWVEINEDWSRS